MKWLLVIIVVGTGSGSGVDIGQVPMLSEIECHTAAETVSGNIISDRGNTEGYVSAKCIRVSQ